MSYQGAAHTNRTRLWQAPGVGPNRALYGGLQTLRNRAREQERNNPWLWKAIEALVANEVGIGVTVRSNAADQSARVGINALWQQATEQLDPAGLLSFGGLQEQAVRARRVGGAVLMRRLWRSPEYRARHRLVLPFQVQVLEPEHLPHELHRSLPDGNEIRGGIEFDRDLRRVAYWLYPRHPHDGASLSLANEPVRVRAEDVIHHFLPGRPGQDHGEPAFVRSLITAKTFDQYADAELRRKESRSAYTGTIELDYGDDAASRLGTANTDGSVTVEAGSFIELNPGEKVKLFDGDSNSAGYWEFARGALLQIAAGAAGVPYELMTGDWQHANDRTFRLVLNEYRRSLEMAQEHLLIFQLCRGLWHWGIDGLVVTGQLTAPGYADDPAPWRWYIARPHRWAYTHPVQDVDAAVRAIAAGLSSRTDAIDQRPGPSAEEIDAQRFVDAQRAAGYGLSDSADGAAGV